MRAATTSTSPTARPSRRSSTPSSSDLGPLDVIVNNAGIMQLGDFHEEDDLVTIRQVDINLHGVAIGTKLALERMRPRRRGHIVNVASSAGKVSPPGGATYVATKHAVVGLTEAVAAENAALGIDCSIVMPGVVNTELATGLAKGRGVKASEPSDVADAIVGALKLPRIDVYVPKSIGTDQPGHGRSSRARSARRSGRR